MSTTGTPGEVSGSDRPACAAELLRALAGHPRLGTVAAALPAAALETAAAQVAKAWELVHAMDYDKLGPLLAQLIRDLDGFSDPDRLVLAAQSYQIASAMLAKAGEPIHATTAARKAVSAAGRAGDRCLVLAGRFRLAHALAAAGDTASALDVLDTAMTTTGSDDPQPPALEVLTGACACLQAVLEARNGRASAAHRHLERAERIARHLDELAAAPDPYGTEFGLANVGAHRVAVALELGQPAQAVAVADTIDTTGLSVERRARLQADVDRAHTQVATFQHGHGDAGT